MKSVAILGASTNRQKFGNIAVRAFRQAGWTVYPVNPRAEMIEELTCYPALDALPDSPDWISVYLPPAITLDTLPAIAACGAEAVYLNPGSEDASVLQRASELRINAHATCSIVAIGLSPAQF